MLILASQSPRRAELLTQLNVSFEKSVADIDETPWTQESATDYVARMAREKVTKVASTVCADSAVLGSDTSVVIDGVILGKPADFNDFSNMMQSLSNRKHQVMTSVCIQYRGELYESLVITDVSFKSLSEQEILWYWHTGEPADKAGGYGIQGLGGQFVTRIEGSYSAVVGLPLYETSQLLEQIGLKNYEC